MTTKELHESIASGLEMITGLARGHRDAGRLVLAEQLDYLVRDVTEALRLGVNTLSALQESSRMYEELVQEEVYDDSPKVSDR